MSRNAPPQPPNRPLVVDLDDDHEAGTAPDPAAAPPVPEADEAGTGLPEGRAMQAAAALAARSRGRGSALGRAFWWLLSLVLGFALSIAAWTFVDDLMARYPLLGWLTAGLICALAVVAAGLALREAAAFARLKRVDALHRAAVAAVAGADLGAARQVTRRLAQLYRLRPDLAPGREALAVRGEEVLDADALLALAERELLVPLDIQAQAEVAAAARQVATVTALVPLALADVATALTANVRMIRRIAEVYGGRSGALGSWRLTRAVLTHLVATGAVAVSDDLVHSVAGGTILSKLSRRFGEGVVNGALTARVGVAAMEVCRPLPFRAVARPRVSTLTGRALAGLFGERGGEKAQE